MIPRILEVAKDRAGSVIVEFAAVLPLLLVVLVGVLQFGLFFFQYISLTGAAEAGARQASISYSDTNAYVDTQTAINNYSSNLKAADLTFTLSVDGTPCTSNAACQIALYNAHTQLYTEPPGSEYATVTVSYSCTTLMPVSWINLSSICPLKSTMTVGVQ